MPVLFEQLSSEGETFPAAAACEAEELLRNFIMKWPATTPPSAQPNSQEGGQPAMDEKSVSHTISLCNVMAKPTPTKQQDHPTSQLSPQVNKDVLCVQELRCAIANGMHALLPITRVANCTLSAASVPLTALAAYVRMHSASAYRRVMHLMRISADKDTDGLLMFLSIVNGDVGVCLPKRHAIISDALSSLKTPQKKIAVCQFTEEELNNTIAFACADENNEVSLPALPQGYIVPDEHRVAFGDVHTRGDTLIADVAVARRFWSVLAELVSDDSCAAYWKACGKGAPCLRTDYLRRDAALRLLSRGGGSTVLAEAGDEFSIELLTDLVKDITRIRAVVEAGIVVPLRHRVVNVPLHERLAANTPANPRHHVAVDVSCHALVSQTVVMNLFSDACGPPLFVAEVGGASSNVFRLQFASSAVAAHAVSLSHTWLRDCWFEVSYCTDNLFQPSPPPSNYSTPATSSPVQQGVPRFAFEAMYQHQMIH